MDRIRTTIQKINSTSFESIIETKQVELYTLSNKDGLELNVTNFGLRVVSLTVPDIENQFDDIVLGFNELKDYRTQEGKYFGCIVGQYANRIKDGIFNIKEEKYQLDINNETNHLHGGSVGYDSVVWEILEATNQKLVFKNVFKDGQNGYPGNVEVRVTYTLTNDNEFRIDYEATTDKTTVINLSNHSFFNLKGEGNGLIDDHLLTVNAESFTPLNKNMIPDGAIKTVRDTPLDFREPKSIGANLDSEHEQLRLANGFDHNFVLNKLQKEELTLAARVEESSSGRIMEVYTTEPGMQFYTGNFLNGSLIGKSGESYYPRSGFCLETQHFPNSPNESKFPSTILQPNDVYRSTTIYKFLTKN